MIILGLHFGHDGAVAVVQDGEVLVSIESERLTRFKHSIGLTIDDIETALQSAGHSLDEIASLTAWLPRSAPSFTFWVSSEACLAWPLTS